MAKMIEIVPEKLTRELTQRNLNYGQVSEAMGHGRNYITDSLRRKRINTSAAVFMEMKYNIKLESYTASEEKQEDPPAEEKPKERQICGGIDYHELGKTIYRAVYQAVKKAWSEYEESMNMKIVLKSGTMKLMNKAPEVKT